MSNYFRDVALEHLQTAAITFERSSGVSIQIGNIRVEFQVAEPDDNEPKAEREVVEERLTLIYKLSGKIGSAPFTFGLVRPEPIGHTDGIPVHLWWRIARNSLKNEVFDLTYTIYTKPVGAPEASTKENHGN